MYVKAVQKGQHLPIWKCVTTSMLPLPLRGETQGDINRKLKKKKKLIQVISRSNQLNRRNFNLILI